MEQGSPVSLAAVEWTVYSVVLGGSMAAGWVLTARLLPPGLPWFVRYPICALAELVAILPAIHVGFAIEKGFSFMRRRMESRRPANAPDYSALIEDYKKTGELPLNWQWTAREFISAANHLRARHEEHDRAVSEVDDGFLFHSTGPMMLLYGLALENLLKGVLIAKGVDATSTGELNRRLKTHNLLALWKQAELPLTSHQQGVLQKLQWSIESGKYPVATKPDSKAPTPVLVALTSTHTILELLESVENALRAASPRTIFEKAELGSL